MLCSKCLVLLLAAIGTAQYAYAGCAPAPSVGGDVIVCEATILPDPAGPLNFLGGSDQVTVNSGAYGAFSFPSGSNVLIFGPSGAPQPSMAAYCSAGDDRTEIHCGTITGTVDQGSGVDSFLMTGGMIVGNLEQSAGTDTFRTSGGTFWKAISPLERR